jgi:hypothetical protein
MVSAAFNPSMHVDVASIHAKITKSHIFKRFEFFTIRIAMNIDILM